MPITTIGTSGGNRQLKNPVVGTSTGNKAVQKIWVGTAGGNRLVWQRVAMSFTANADRWDRVILTWNNLGTGTTYTVKKAGATIYSGTALTYTDGSLEPQSAHTYTLEATRSGASAGTAIASATTPALVMTPMTAAGVSTSQINLTWTNPGGLTAVRLRDSAGGSQSLASNATSGSRTGLAAGTSYNFAVDGQRGAVFYNDRAQATASTQAPQFQAKSAILTCVSLASYKGDNTRRTDKSDAYYGVYSSWGNQKSLWCFDIPADVRGCVSVDIVEFAIWSSHTWDNAGANVGLVVHHGDYRQGFGNTFPGSTGAFGTFRAPKTGWISGGWTNVTSYVCPGRTTVAEEFRANGAWGMGLVATSTGSSGYGYALGTGPDRPRMHISYTVRI